MIKCLDCKFSGQTSKFPPCPDTHYDRYCPECGSTNLDTSELNADWKKNGEVYSYGDNNSLNTYRENSKIFSARKQLSPEIIIKCLELVRLKIQERLKEKGNMSFIGPHETYGIIAEEVNKLLDAIHCNSSIQVFAELLDIAVAAVLGMVSQDTLYTKPSGTEQIEDES